MITAVLAAAALACPQEAKLKAALPEVFAKSAAHYRAIDAAATPLMDKGEDGMKRVPHGWNAKEGKPDMRSIRWWTSGHYPGSLWYLYEATGDEFFKERAVAWTEILEPNKSDSSHHDTGFMMYCSYGNARRVLKTDKYDAILVETAGSLSKRFNEKLGLIRSWGDIEDKKDFLVIPDNMMNLELLEWAAKNGGDKNFLAVAKSHADKTNRNHFRPDSSAYHILDYNPENGKIYSYRAGQGASADGTWARGQAWAVYGFTMMYRETKDPAYLERAMRCADYVLAAPNMPADKVTYWDFKAPRIPNEERDTSAAAILASAFLELSTYAHDARAHAYRAFAVRSLLSLVSPAYFAKPGENGGFLLMHGVGHKPGGSEVDVPLNYGDYYFLEALIRFWRSVES